MLLSFNRKLRSLFQLTSTKDTFFGLRLYSSAGKPKSKSKKVVKSKDPAKVQPVIEYDSTCDKNLIIPEHIWSSLSFSDFSSPLKKQKPPPERPQLPNTKIVNKVPQFEKKPSDGTVELDARAIVKEERVQITFPLIASNRNINPDAPQKIMTLPFENPQKLGIPSVTQILRETMSEESSMFLAIWRKRKIAEVGEDGLKTYMREVKTIGKDLHLGIETHLRGVPYETVPVDPKLAGHWLSLRAVFPSISDVHALESYVVHPQLMYKGCVDCVALYQDTLAVIEWKTSHRPKATLSATYDDPVQLAAYVGALNADPNYPFKVDNAVVVVAYPTGAPADVHYLDRDQCEKYWEMWLQRLSNFREKYKETENAK